MKNLLLLIGVFGYSLLFCQNLRIERIEFATPNSKINLHQIFESDEEFEEKGNILKPKWFKTCKEAGSAASALIEKKKLYFINYSIDDTKIFEYLLRKRYNLKLLRVGHIKVETYSCFNNIVEDHLNRQYGYNVIDSTYLEAKELGQKVGVIDIKGALKTVLLDEVLDNSLQLAQFKDDLEEDLKGINIDEGHPILVKVAFTINSDGSLKNIELFSESVSLDDFSNLQDAIYKNLKRQKWKSGLYRCVNVPTFTEIRLEMRK